MFRPASFHDGEVIEEQEERADKIFYLMEGTVGTERKRKGGVVRSSRIQTAGPCSSVAIEELSHCLQEDIGRERLLEDL